MTISPDELKVRLRMAIATLKRLTDDVHTDEDTHVALCRAMWRLHYQLELIETTERR